MLPTPKVNKLQSPKLRLTQSLLVAIFTPNFMRFRYTAMEQCGQNTSSIQEYNVHVGVTTFAIQVNLHGNR